MARKKNIYRVRIVHFYPGLNDIIIPYKTKEGAKAFSEECARTGYWHEIFSNITGAGETSKQLTRMVFISPIAILGCSITVKEEDE